VTVVCGCRCGLVSGCDIQRRFGTHTDSHVMPQVEKQANHESDHLLLPSVNNNGWNIIAFSGIYRVSYIAPGSRQLFFPRIPTSNAAFRYGHHTKGYNTQVTVFVTWLLRNSRGAVWQLSASVESKFLFITTLRLYLMFC
jgi:hypothetical protein